MGVDKPSHLAYNRYVSQPYPHPPSLTLVDIKNALLSHFVSSSTFDVSTDTDAFKIDPKEVGEDFVANLQDIVTVALEDLVRLGMVARAREGLYVLTQPITQMNQTIVISPFTALMLADMVNGWAEKTGEMKETGYVVNKLAITDRDVNAICQICGILLSQNDELEEDEDDDDGEDDE